MSRIKTPGQTNPLPELGPARLLTREAKARLAPLGCMQVGRSRLWIADQRFWAVVVELKPGRFGQQGSSLVVGVMWHWYAKNFWSYDYGVGQQKWEYYWDDRQFLPLARGLVRYQVAPATTIRLPVRSESYHI